MHPDNAEPSIYGRPPRKPDAMDYPALTLPKGSVKARHKVAEHSQRPVVLAKVEWLPGAR